MEDITDADYAHTKRVFKYFKIKYCDLYVQSNTLLLADVFENIYVLKYTNLILQNFYQL